MAKSSKKKNNLSKIPARKQHVRTKAERARTPAIDHDPEQAAAPHPGQPTAPVPPAASLALHASPEVLNRLWLLIDSRKGANPELSHSARLLARGTPRVAQKLGEEAVECLIEAMAGNHSGVIGESADLLYHILVTWVDAGIRPEEVWLELQKREKASYLAEGADVPLKRILGSVQTRTKKIP